jgi:hypothetical protein
MRNIAKGDVSKLCEHTRELIYELNATGETTNDLLANLIEALKEAPDSNFQRWLSNQLDQWSLRKIDWKEDGSDLMEEAEVYYQEAINTHRWGKKAYKPNVQYAFKATDSGSETEEEVRKPAATSYEDTIKALSAQLEKYAKAYTARWSGPDPDKEKRYAWKKVPPKDGEPSTKKVLMDGQTKTYHWCTFHKQWTIHTPQECKRAKSTMKGYKSQKDKKAFKRQNFKERKNAYIQAKAAYQACLIGSADDDVESSNSDNKEDSNKSISSYSSEESKVS